MIGEHLVLVLQVINLFVDVAVTPLPDFRICLTDFPSFLGHDGSELGCPIFAATMCAVQCFDDKHGMTFQLPELAR